MSEANEFTPKERLVVDYERAPSALFTRTLLRRLGYVVPSLVLVTMAIVRKEYELGLLGYAVLIVQQIESLFVLHRGLRTQRSIIEKYEARLRQKDASAGGAPAADSVTAPSPPPSAPPAP